MESKCGICGKQFKEGERILNEESVTYWEGKISVKYRSIHPDCDPQAIAVAMLAGDDYVWDAENQRMVY